MVRIYIARPDRYLKMVRSDKKLVELYGDYTEDELRGLVGVTIQGFNSLRELSFAERNIARPDDSRGPIDEAVEVAKAGLRAFFGNYTRATCVFGKPSIIETVTQPHQRAVDRPVNGYPFLDHSKSEVATYFQRQCLGRGAFCFDTEGNVFGAREIVVPATFELNGAGEEVTAVLGEGGGSVNQEHVQAAHASEKGLSSIVLSKDGSVITFFGGYPIRDLTYKPGDK